MVRQNSAISWRSSPSASVISLTFCPSSISMPMQTTRPLMASKAPFSLRGFNDTVSNVHYHCPRALHGVRSLCCSLHSLIHRNLLPWRPTQDSFTNHVRSAFLRFAHNGDFCAIKDFDSRPTIPLL